MTTVLLLYHHQHFGVAFERSSVACMTLHGVVVFAPGTYAPCKITIDVLLRARHYIVSPNSINRV